jgi:hypothetical protein
MTQREIISRLLAHGWSTRLARARYHALTRARERAPDPPFWRVLQWRTILVRDDGRILRHTAAVDVMPDDCRVPYSAHAGELARLNAGIEPPIRIDWLTRVNQ